jgi:hypothetical protein
LRLLRDRLDKDFLGGVVLNLGQRASGHQSTLPGACPRPAEMLEPMACAISSGISAGWGARSCLSGWTARRPGSGPDTDARSPPKPHTRNIVRWPSGTRKT